MGPGPEHKRLEVAHEHGQDWETCLTCGAQWTIDGEEVSEGDGYCLDASREE